jgi:hypothetical protein
MALKIATAWWLLQGLCHQGIGHLQVCSASYQSVCVCVCGGSGVWGEKGGEGWGLILSACSHARSDPVAGTGMLTIPTEQATRTKGMKARK